MKPEPIAIDLPEGSLDELDRRLAAVRWPDVIGPDDWMYGAPVGWMRDMVDYWRDEWSWDTERERMQAWDHYRVEIDGVPIHYLHAPSPNPNALPLVLNHGWPWTFWDFKDVIEPLRADFDVYVPSLPGFGFSTPLTLAGIDVVRIAELWVSLFCEVLGHERFCVHGGDWGALITAQLAHAHADRLIGAHLSMAMVPGVARQDLSADAWEGEEWKRDRNAEAEPLIRSHVTVHTLDPQTLAYGLADSPVGTAAWIWERRRNWSDNDGDVEAVFTREHLCTTAALYWCTGAIVSSLRLYREQFTKKWPLAHERMPRLEAPTAWAVFPRDVVHLPRSVLESHSDLRQYTVMDRGGHFGAAEDPAALAADLRTFFSSLTT